ncbi:MAG TPA: AAA family ATPase [Candidatus Paceibacterota bacterium]|nr:AAA family ATPase [Candidatus Paceibacterota bacterium]
MITGGPCAGKSTLLANARCYFENRGLRALVLTETVTELSLGGLPPQEQWRTPISFQRMALGFQLSRENEYYRIAQELSVPKKTILLCDRGALDGMAYIKRHEFLRVCEELECSPADLLDRYAGIIHLVTAAEGKEEYYTLANNSARTESAEEARRIDKRLLAAWAGHERKAVIGNSTGFNEKMDRGLRAAARFANMPGFADCERKFILRNFAPWFIPRSAVKIHIEQAYLALEGEVERRVRARRIDGATSYYYTELRPTPESGVRQKVTSLIPRREYEILLDEGRGVYPTVSKERYCFPYEGKQFEVDQFLKPQGVPILFEVKMETMDEPIRFPSHWDANEVTGNAEFSNRNIALRS